MSSSRIIIAEDPKDEGQKAQEELKRKNKMAQPQQPVPQPNIQQLMHPSHKEVITTKPTTSTPQEMHRQTVPIEPASPHKAVDWSQFRAKPIQTMQPTDKPTSATVSVLTQRIQQKTHDLMKSIESAPAMTNVVDKAQNTSEDVLNDITTLTDNEIESTHKIVDSIFDSVVGAKYGILLRTGDVGEAVKLIHSAILKTRDAVIDAKRNQYQSVLVDVDSILDEYNNQFNDITDVLDMKRYISASIGLRRVLAADIAQQNEIMVQILRSVLSDALATTSKKAGEAMTHALKLAKNDKDKAILKNMREDMPRHKATEVSLATNFIKTVQSGSKLSRLADKHGSKNMIMRSAFDIFKLAHKATPDNEDTVLRTYPNDLANAVTDQLLSSGKITEDDVSNVHSDFVTAFAKMAADARHTAIGEYIRHSVKFRPADDTDASVTAINEIKRIRHGLGVATSSEFDDRVKKVLGPISSDIMSEIKAYVTKVDMHDDVSRRMASKQIVKIFSKRVPNIIASLSANEMRRNGMVDVVVRTAMTANDSIKYYGETDDGHVPAQIVSSNEDANGNVASYTCELISRGNDVTKHEIPAQVVINAGGGDMTLNRMLGINNLIFVKMANGEIDSTDIRFTNEAVKLNSITSLQEAITGATSTPITSAITDVVRSIPAKIDETAQISGADTNDILAAIETQLHVAFGGVLGSLLVDAHDAAVMSMPGELDQIHKSTIRDRLTRAEITKSNENLVNARHSHSISRDMIAKMQSVDKPAGMDTKQIKRHFMDMLHSIGATGHMANTIYQKMNNIEDAVLKLYQGPAQSDAFYTEVKDMIDAEAISTYETASSVLAAHKPISVLERDATNLKEIDELITLSKWAKDNAAEMNKSIDDIHGLMSPERGEGVYKATQPANVVVSVVATKALNGMIERFPQYASVLRQEIAPAISAMAFDTDPIALGKLPLEYRHAIEDSISPDAMAKFVSDNSNVAVVNSIIGSTSIDGVPQWGRVVSMLQDAVTHNDVHTEDSISATQSAYNTDDTTKISTYLKEPNKQTRDEINRTMSECVSRLTKDASIRMRPDVPEDRAKLISDNKDRIMSAINAYINSKFNIDRFTDGIIGSIKYDGSEPLKDAIRASFGSMIPDMRNAAVGILDSGIDTNAIIQQVWPGSDPRDATKFAAVMDAVDAVKSNIGETNVLSAISNGVNRVYSAVPDNIRESDSALIINNVAGHMVRRRHHLSELRDKLSNMDQAFSNIDVATELGVGNVLQMVHETLSDNPRVEQHHMSRFYESGTNIITSTIDSLYKKSKKGDGKPSDKTSEALKNLLYVMPNVAQELAKARQMAPAPGKEAVEPETKSGIHEDLQRIREQRKQTPSSYRDAFRSNLDKQIRINLSNAAMLSDLLNHAGAAHHSDLKSAITTVSKLIATSGGDAGRFAKFVDAPDDESGKNVMAMTIASGVNSYVAMLINTAAPSILADIENEATKAGKLIFQYKPTGDPKPERVAMLGLQDIIMEVTADRVGKLINSVISNLSSDQSIVRICNAAAKVSILKSYTEPVDSELTLTINQINHDTEMPHKKETGFKRERGIIKTTHGMMDFANHLTKAVGADISIDNVYDVMSRQFGVKQSYSHNAHGVAAGVLHRDHVSGIIDELGNIQGYAAEVQQASAADISNIISGCKSGDEAQISNGFDLISGLVHSKLISNVRNMLGDADVKSAYDASIAPLISSCVRFAEAHTKASRAALPAMIELLHNIHDVVYVDSTGVMAKANAHDSYTARSAMAAAIRHDDIITKSRNRLLGARILQSQDGLQKYMQLLTKKWKSDLGVQPEYNLEDKNHIQRASISKRVNEIISERKSTILSALLNKLMSKAVKTNFNLPDQITARYLAIDKSLKPEDITWQNESSIIAKLNGAALKADFGADDYYFLTNRMQVAMLRNIALANYVDSKLSAPIKDRTMQSPVEKEVAYTDAGIEFYTAPVVDDGTLSSAFNNFESTDPGKMGTLARTIMGNTKSVTENGGYGYIPERKKAQTRPLPLPAIWLVKMIKGAAEDLSSGTTQERRDLNLTKAVDNVMVNALDSKVGIGTLRNYKKIIPERTAYKWDHVRRAVSADPILSGIAKWITTAAKRVKASGRPNRIIV